MRNIHNAVVYILSTRSIVLEWKYYITMCLAAYINAIFVLCSYLFYKI